MPSDKAIKAAQLAYRETAKDTACQIGMSAALAAAYAIDGDFNAGVEAAKAAVEELRQPAIAGAFDAHNARAWNGVLDIVLEALENLKR